jgi:hypothetical protein
MRHRWRVTLCHAQFARAQRLQSRSTESWTKDAHHTGQPCSVMSGPAALMQGQVNLKLQDNGRVRCFICPCMQHHNVLQRIHCVAFGPVRGGLQGEHCGTQFEVLYPDACMHAFNVCESGDVVSSRAVSRGRGKHCSSMVAVPCWNHALHTACVFPLEQMRHCDVCRYGSTPGSWEGNIVAL